MIGAKSGAPALQLEKSTTSSNEVEVGTLAMELLRSLQNSEGINSATDLSGKVAACRAIPIVSMACIIEHMGDLGDRVAGINAAGTGEERATLIAELGFDLVRHHFPPFAIKWNISVNHPPMPFSR